MNITLDPADLSPPLHDTLLVGLDTAIASQLIRYVGTQVTIADQSSKLYNAAVPWDVSGDGVVSPIDVLRVINFLSRYGSAADVDQVLASQHNGNFLDTNNDGAISRSML